MDEKELAQLRSTMPWKHRFFTHPKAGGIVQVIDRNGNEVPLFPMVRFLDLITAKLAGNPTATPVQPQTNPETPK